MAFALSCNELHNVRSVIYRFCLSLSDSTRSKYGKFDPGTNHGWKVGEQDRLGFSHARFSLNMRKVDGKSSLNPWIFSSLNAIGKRTNRPTVLVKNF